MLAYRALEAGPSHAVVLNAANEVAVASYLEEKISFIAIPRVIEQAMDAHSASPVDDSGGGTRGGSLGPALFQERGSGVRIEGLRFCNLTTLLAFAFVLGVLIFVHELGHFVMARRVGIRVLKFSLGFGPRLVGFKRGDTEYVISAIPLGGYVKMAGENPDDPRSGRDDEFLSKTKWQRFQVLIMGPLMNLILAVVVTAGVLDERR